VHLTGRRAGLVAAGGDVGRLVLTHLVDWNDPQVTLAEAREVFAGQIDLAAPGAVYEL
jgi:ribonuclease BN (tRNA processing enzyme)